MTVKVRSAAAVVAAVLAALAMVAPGVASAQGAEITVLEFSIDEPTINANQCTGDLELLLGRIMILSHVVTDADGGTHIHGTAVMQQFTATSLTTGDVSHLIQTSPFNVFSAVVGASTSTIIGHFKHVGAGGVSVLFSAHAHFTLTPAGELVVSFDRFTVDCA
jgi:hypothetical protein